MATKARTILFALIASVALCPAAPSVAIAASLADVCAAGAAPPGWLRPGGYCDIAADLHQKGGFTTGPAQVCHTLHTGGKACLIGQTSGGLNIYIVSNSGPFNGTKLIGEPHGGWTD